MVRMVTVMGTVSGHSLRAHGNSNGHSVSQGSMATVMGTMTAGEHGNINGNSVTRGTWQQQRERCERGTWQQRGAQCQPGHMTTSINGNSVTRVTCQQQRKRCEQGTWQQPGAQCQPRLIATVMSTMTAGAHGNINSNSVTKGTWQQQRARCKVTGNNLRAHWPDTHTLFPQTLHSRIDHVAAPGLFLDGLWRHNEDFCREIDDLLTHHNTGTAGKETNITSA
ncbi:hypothetical protein ACOMHN_057130 [Nucella lapillus]